VGGISGVGKTTLLQRHVLLHPCDQQITGSSVIKQIIAPAAFHELDAWPMARREQVREESIARLEHTRAACPGQLLIDGHFTLRNRQTGVLEPVFTPGDCDFYQALVLVDCTASQVTRQRAQDQARRNSKADDDTSRIEEHLEFERSWAARLRDRMDVPLLVIDHTDLERRLAALAEFLGQFVETAGG